MPATELAAHCPGCGSDLCAPEGVPPWCPACEWNLAIYDPVVLPARGWLWLERWGHGVASRVDQRLFGRYTVARPERLRWTGARVALVVVSAGLTLVCLGSLALGIWFIARDFPSPWMFAGIGLLLVAFVLRPRLGRGPRRKHRLRRERAPGLFALIDRVSAAVGAPPPDAVVLGADFNASVRRYGLRGHHELSIGVPLWLSLAPQMRVALLAHELGHLVNGDPKRGLLIEPSLSTFWRLADATGAQRTLAYVFDPDRDGRNIGQLVVELVLWAVSRVFLLIHIGVLALGFREQHRSEYLADAVAADVAGTEAVAGMLDRLLLSDEIGTIIHHSAVTERPSRWPEIIDSLHERRRADIGIRRQLSRRTTSLWLSHPPSGLRARLVEAWPAREPAVVPSESDLTTIDQELQPWHAAAHKVILGTRDFHPRS